MVSGHLAYATAMEHQKDLLRTAEHERRFSRQRRRHPSAADGAASGSGTVTALRWAFHLPHGLAAPR